MDDDAVGVLELTEALPPRLRLGCGDHFGAGGLQGPVRDYVPELPFHTTGLEWEVGPVADDQVETLSTEEMETIYRQIAAQVSDLMELLRGRDAR